MAGMLLVLTVVALAGALAATAAAQGSEPVKYVCNFGGPSEVAAFKVTGGKATWSSGTEDDVPVEGTAFEPTNIAAGAMYIAMEPYKPMTLEYSASNGLPSDWSGYDRFVMYFENGSEFMINLWLTVTDASGRHRHPADNLWIVRSQNSVDFPLAELRTEGRRSLSTSTASESIRLEILLRREVRAATSGFSSFASRSAPRRSCRVDARTMLINFAPLGASFTPGAQAGPREDGVREMARLRLDRRHDGLTSINFSAPRTSPRPGSSGM